MLENQASDGAGLYLSTAVGYISDGTRFQSNIATKTGGGVFASNEARVVFMDSDISLNEATNGGAIYGVDFESTGLNIEIMGNVTLRQNTAEENGGALYLEGNRTTFLIEGESRVEENNAKSKGGGICAVDIQPFLAKSTAFVNNGATNGGAVYVEVCFPKLRNLITLNKGEKDSCRFSHRELFVRYQQSELRRRGLFPKLEFEESDVGLQRRDLIC